jgi:CHAD domain-containing protein
MPFAIQPDEPMEATLRRVAREQFHKILDAFDDASLDRTDTVHAARKRVKKLRGLLRLVRYALKNGTYVRENAGLRDAGRSLAPMRDAAILLATFEDLAASCRAELPNVPVDFVRKQLERKRAGIEADPAQSTVLIARFASTIGAARARSASWRLDDNGFDAIARGLEKTYARGRKALAAAEDEPAPERFHAWRKRVKYHAIHLRLLEPVWPRAIRAARKTADELGDQLGDLHDLHVLELHLRRTGQGDVEPVFAAIERRRGELRRQALRLGRRLYAEQPRAFVKRMRRYHEGWHGAERD